MINLMFLILLTVVGETAAAQYPSKDPIKSIAKKLNSVVDHYYVIPYKMISLEWVDNCRITSSKSVLTQLNQEWTKILKKSVEDSETVSNSIEMSLIDIRNRLHNRPVLYCTRKIFHTSFSKGAYTYQRSFAAVGGTFKLLLEDGFNRR